VQQRIPIYLAAVGPANLRLCGQLADGWLGLFFSPGQASTFLDPISRGRVEAGADPTRPLEGFDVCVSLPAAVADDVSQAADAVRGHYALYIGGMGSREKNFYHRVATRLGFADQADRVQDLYLAGRTRDAAAAVPLDLIEATALIGPPPRLARQLQAFASAGVGTVAVMPFATDHSSQAATVTAVATAARAADVIEEHR
jgi:alkanesulfonate monooxygenase SsuD/methylene tetrahydromethanopterin reductase-like flavin-dependent oxidoreductase (luciferase family)